MPAKLYTYTINLLYIKKKQEENIANKTIITNRLKLQIYYTI